MYAFKYISCTGFKEINSFIYGCFFLPLSQYNACNKIYEKEKNSWILFKIIKVSTVYLTTCMYISNWYTFFFKTKIIVWNLNWYSYLESDRISLIDDFVFTLFIHCF